MNADELIRASYAAFNSRDYDALRKLYAPDCIWDADHLETWPGSQRYDGHDGLVSFAEDWWGSFEEMTTRPVEIAEGPGGVYVLAHLDGVARGGLEVDWEVSQVVTIAESGQIARVSHYTDANEARAAAGV